LNKILEVDPSIVVILITGYGDIELAVRASKRSHQLPVKTLGEQETAATIKTSMQLRQSKLELQELRTKQKVLMADQNQPFVTIIGSSPAMQKVFSIALKVAATDANVLILGENGTGKELIARAIHRDSRRKDEVFISVDLGLSANPCLKASFSDLKKALSPMPRKTVPGASKRLTRAPSSWMRFGNLTLSLQSKLLSVLQNRNVVRLGTNKEIPIDVRLICATNMPLYQMVREGKFRQDLLYRINTVEVHVPSLRERIEDIPALIEHFLEIYCHKYKIAMKRVSEDTLSRLKKHDWPGTSGNCNMPWKGPSS